MVSQGDNIKWASKEMIALKDMCFLICSCKLGNSADSVTLSFTTEYSLKPLWGYLARPLCNLQNNLSDFLHSRSAF